MISEAFLVYFIAILVLSVTMLLISHLLNPKTKMRSDSLPFESGIIPYGDTNLRWGVNYFLVAILFVIFDIEAVFLYIWAIVVLDAGWQGFIASSVFIGILLIALGYEWRMGVLQWGKKIN